MGWAYSWRTMRSGSISGADTDLLCDFWQDTQEWILPPLTGNNSRLALREQCQRCCLQSWVRWCFLSKHWLKLCCVQLYLQGGRLSHVLGACSSPPTQLQQLEISASEHPRGANNPPRDTSPFKSLVLGFCMLKQFLCHKIGFIL